MEAHHSQRVFPRPRLASCPEGVWGYGSIPPPSQALNVWTKEHTLCTNTVCQRENMLRSPDSSPDSSLSLREIYSSSGKVTCSWVAQPCGSSRLLSWVVFKVCSLAPLGTLKTAKGTREGMCFGLIWVCQLKEIPLCLFDIFKLCKKASFGKAGFNIKEWWARLP